MRFGDLKKGAQSFNDISEAIFFLFLLKHKQDYSGFVKWADHFFCKQKTEIVDVFEPCCQVFVNTFKLADFDFNSEFLSEYAEMYASDGVDKALSIFKKTVDGGDFLINVQFDAERMANRVINLIGSKAKEAVK